MSKHNCAKSQCQCISAATSAVWFSCFTNTLVDVVKTYAVSMTSMAHMSYQSKSNKQVNAAKTQLIMISTGPYLTYLVTPWHLRDKISRDIITAMWYHTKLIRIIQSIWRKHEFYDKYLLLRHYFGHISDFWALLIVRYRTNQFEQASRCDENVIIMISICIYVTNFATSVIS